MKVCFVLPRFSRIPVGGYKIVYEYANRLHIKGHDIVILYLNDYALTEKQIPEFLRRIIVNILTKIMPNWFDLNPKIKQVSNMQRNYLSIVCDSDICVATAIETVEEVKSNFSDSRKLYLIQGFENWVYNDEYIYNSFDLGFTNIVVSSWLKDIVDKHSKSGSVLIKNPIDLSLYRCIKSQKDRKRHSIGLLYHEAPCKGISYAMEVINMLKKRYDDLDVYMFGTYSRPQSLPDWVRYKANATAKETVNLYNEVQVFLCASVEEGFGLTGMEAMACGACLVSTEYLGVLEYAKNEYNSLLSPIKNTDKLYENVIKVFDDDEYREKLVNNGMCSLGSYSWDSAVEEFEGIIRL